MFRISAGSSQRRIPGREILPKCYLEKIEDYPKNSLGRSNLELSTINLQSSTLQFRPFFFRQNTIPIRSLRIPVVRVTTGLFIVFRILVELVPVKLNTQTRC